MKPRDEAENQYIHQWLSVCRQLMVGRPIEGVEHLMSSLRGDEFKPGWNVMLFEDGRPPAYFFVENDSVRKTNAIGQGVSASDIHRIEIKSAKDVRETSFWKSVEEGLTEHASPLAALPEFGRAPLSVLRRRLEKWFTLKAHRSGWVTIRGYPALLRSTWKNLGDRDRAPEGKPLFLRLMNEVAKTYMNFEIPGYIAALLFHDFLRKQDPATIFSRRKREASVYYRKVVEALGSAAYRILELRSSANLSGFNDLTFLGQLYATSALIMTSPRNLQYWVAAREEQKKIQALRVVIDELQAHNFHSTFELPSLMPVHVIVRRLVATRSPLNRQATEAYLHPAVARVAADLDKAPLTSDQIQARFVSDATSGTPIVISDVIEHESAAAWSALATD